jgi:hypothetical protein
VSRTSTRARRKSVAARIGHVARRAVSMEIGVWQSLYRFVFRRPRVPAGAASFPYHGPVLSILLVFVVLSAIEIPILDLVVHRWPAVRIPLLILGIWGLTFMIGMLLGFLTRPHAVGPDGVRIRQGAELEIRLSWDDIASIAKVHRVAEPKAPRISDDPAGPVLELRIANETNLEILFDRPRAVALPQGTTTLAGVRLHADDAEGFFAEARRYL